MKFGLTASEYKFLKENVVDPLKAFGAKVYIFGSRAQGTHIQFSDIDILVECDQDPSKLISEISEQAEASNFIYKLDIVFERSLANAYRTSIHRDKVLL